MSRLELEQAFPRLAKEGYRITSPIDSRYNCMAWAIEKMDLVFWPDTWNLFAWPDNVNREEGLQTFISFFQKLSYQICDNENVEEGFEKVALYADEYGRGSHAARQLKNGKWTSKLGPDEDIEHNTLTGLEGAKLGKVVQVFKRSTRRN